MARRRARLSSCVAAICCVAAVSPDNSCEVTDTYSMLQTKHPQVRVASEEATSQRITSASDALASAHFFVDAIKANKDSASDVILAARSNSEIVRSEVIPALEASAAEAGKFLAERHAAVRQCDVELEVAFAKREGFGGTFQQKRAKHEACTDAVSDLSKEITKCAKNPASEHGNCLDIQSFRSKKVEECEYLHAELHSDVCGQVLIAQGTCQAYSDCRSRSLAAYESARHTFEVQARDHHQQLLEARRAQCITGALTTLEIDEESMLGRMEACSEVGEVTEDAISWPMDALPSARPCQDARVLTCSGGFLEFATGPGNETWSGNCSACRAASVADQATGDKSEPLSGWVSSQWAQWSAHTVSLFAVGTEAVSRAAVAASNVATSAIGAKTAGVSAAYVGLMLGIIFCALGGALCLTIDSDSPTMVDYKDNTISARAHHPGDAGTPLAVCLSRRPSGSGEPWQTLHSTPTLRSINEPPCGSIISRGQVDSPSPSPARALGVAAVGLCPELTIPEGNECILGIPSLAQLVPGEVLKTVNNKDGQALLYVGLTRSPTGGEYVLLTRRDRQELAFCETGPSVRSQGFAGRVCRNDGEVYAWLREWNETDEQRWAAAPLREWTDDSEPRTPLGQQTPWSAIPGPHRSFVMFSAIGPAWEVRITGNFRERMLAIEDGRSGVLAMVSPTEDLSGRQRAAGDSYRLRLGPGADACAMIVAIMAIERLWERPIPPTVASRVPSRGMSRGASPT